MLNLLKKSEQEDSMLNKKMQHLKIIQLILLGFALMFFLERDIPHNYRPFGIEYISYVFIPLFFLSGVLHEFIRRKLAVNKFILWNILIVIVALLILMIGYTLIYYSVVEEFELRFYYALHKTYAILILFLIGWLVSFLFNYFKLSIRVEKRI